MTNLQGNNTKLKTLLSTIDIENAAFRINEEYLKDRIVET